MLISKIVFTAFLIVSKLYFRSKIFAAYDLDDYADENLAPSIKQLVVNLGNATKG